ncbi:TNT domain-containing protein [Micromonospora sp. NBC_01699]|uniref:TNT domain-containing protein n=1 Tax=Micromonospora sp. NBC_01699 TaxID=2975984 RepID=UPI002E35E8F1|nr:TNT domain-containing protein [Micromonospora sp. NBC_01699]
MKIRSLASAALVAVLLVTAPPLPAYAGPVPAVSACRPGTPDQATPTQQFHNPARPELGPAQLPADRPVGPLLFGYQRFGGLTEAEFVAKYRGETGWTYPPADGFLVVDGQPVRLAQTLWAGSRVDRFGYPGGGYLAPARTLFLQRALPPQNLNTPSGTPASNYHLYCVLRAFRVDSGPIAPWFGQLGLGLQYKLESRHLPKAPSPLSVAWLLDNGYLVEERPAG